MIAIFPDAESLSRGTAALVADRAREAIAATGRFTVALSGGSTPHRCYELLASAPFAAAVAWDRVQILWGDERCVPPDNARSNYRMAREALLDKVPIPAANIHRIAGELAPEDAADDYQARLGALFSGAPSFDLVLLGLGENGHTASLFPHTPALDETERWVVAVRPAGEEPRITLTAPVINTAQTVAFQVSGAKKRAVLREVRHGPRDPARLPAQLIAPESGDLRWLVDTAVL